MTELVQGWIAAYGYAALFGILMFGIVGVPFPDDLTLAFSGYLVSAGYLNPYLTLISAFFGSVCGITVSYGLGHFLGTSVVEKYGRIFIPALLKDNPHIDQASYIKRLQALDSTTRKQLLEGSWDAAVGKMFNRNWLKIITKSQVPKDIFKVRYWVPG